MKKCARKSFGRETPPEGVGEGNLGKKGNRERRRRGDQGKKIIWKKSVRKSSRGGVLLGGSVRERFQRRTRVGEWDRENT